MSAVVDDQPEVIGSMKPNLLSILFTNASLPVNNLPPEILVSIFTLVQLVYGWRPARAPFRKARPQWLRITWVCQYWRRIALGTPTLWSIVDDTGGWRDPSWLPVFLERAGDVPLDVTIRAEERRRPNVLNEDPIKPLHHHASRIAQLDLWCRSPGVLSPFSGSFSVLEDLCMSSPDLDQPQELLELWRQRFPFLRKLHIDRLPIRWDTDIFASLQMLEITMIPESQRASPSVVLRILREAPGLQHLKLSVSSLLPAEQEAVRTRTDPISHHTLRYVHLCGPPTSLSHIYDRVSLSPECKIAAHHYVSEPPSDMRLVLPVQLAFKSLLGQCTGLTADITARGLLLDARRYKDAGPSKVEVVMRLYHTSIPPSSLWPHMADAIDIVPLTYLSLSSTSLSDVSAALWRGLLSRLPQLTHLRISAVKRSESSSWLEKLENALQPLESHNASPTSILCPSLETLALCVITLTPARVEGILRFLDARADQVARISSLAFTQAFCEVGIDVGMLKASLEEHVRLTIKYHQSRILDCTVDGFRYSTVSGQ
ncbi:hypothetical protein OH76DRAFT_1412767 [Lentinus brumalis]|uniref:Uncharacterized protein n=1 Tax=Lentinus brumalis TaxID=2498619 RepID=A0A371CKB4_9APHY|nr:hypothetical protein OH76DRAFT_1412767 [Polyporus brumalis]